MPVKAMLPVNLDTQESDTLCRLLMEKFILSGGLEKQPAWALDLYEKIARVNDSLLGKAQS